MKPEIVNIALENMCKNIVDGIEETLSKFTPRERYTITNANNVPLKYLEHPVSY